jgi:hypothetical protein
MIKITPDPPDIENDSLARTKPKPDRQSGYIFTVVDGIDTERLLTNLSETLASANAMASDLAFEREGSRRHFALGIQQMIELGELLANRALDDLDPRKPLEYRIKP